MNPIQRRDGAPDVCVADAMDYFVDLGSTREMTCPCGRTFQQFRVAQRFAETWTKILGPSFPKVLQQATHQGYVPKFCTSCERKELAAEARGGVWGKSAA